MWPAANPCRQTGQGGPAAAADVQGLILFLESQEAQGPVGNRRMAVVHAPEHLSSLFPLGFSGVSFPGHFCLGVGLVVDFLLHSFGSLSLTAGAVAVVWILWIQYTTESGSTTTVFPAAVKKLGRQGAA